ncbi:MAG: bifunctional phosphopantothenoylcysteine decarboxylase/phosphopantothenate--cysteine ligase CoaBC [Nitrospirota bacterium]|jgi:phosphopantothenoylcysteine decarboxylase/phosphopantothenate--cysteine ligase
MRRRLRDRKILHGITGSVAAYKAIDLIRRLKDEGASVAVVMTDASRRFITPLLVEAASGCPPGTDMFGEPMAHISLPRQADLLLVAPASAHTLAKLASGWAGDLLSASYLSFTGKVVVAPAMNWRMYENPAVRRNLAVLAERGVLEVPPEEGALACAEEGKGRMAGIPAILEAVKTALSKKDLAGKRVVVTAGPTREHIDPVRFISNRSSGKMGYAVAAAARRRGADVTLVSGPSVLAPPPAVALVRVESASQMREAVLEETVDADVLVMAAAVADFVPTVTSGTKLPKETLRRIELAPAPDILAEVGAMGRRPFVVGFAAETGPGLGRASEKLQKKNVDMVVFNDVSQPGSGFDSDTNKVTIVQGGARREYPLMSKEEVAEAILDGVCGARG